MLNAVGGLVNYPDEEAVFDSHHAVQRMTKELVILWGSTQSKHHVQEHELNRSKRQSTSEQAYLTARKE